MKSHFADPVALLAAARDLYRAGGLPRGSRTGWLGVDALYTVATGQWTVVTGMPQSGKSEWLDALCVNLARDDEWSFTVFSPENHPTQAHVVKLVEKIVGKPFNAGPTARMTLQEFDAAAEWLLERFKFLAPEEHSPENLMATACAYRDKTRKHGIVLDPWNTLDHERRGMSETDYISWMLGHVVRMVREFNVHVWLVVHPQKLLRLKDGTLPVPRPYDISGSAHWYNKADNIITVHRDQTDPDSDEVEIHVQKVRFKHVGHIGVTTLRYARPSGRYYEAPYIHDATTGRAERYA